MKKVKPEVRMIVYFGKDDDDSPIIKQFHSMTSVSTTMGFGGAGSATVTLSNKEYRFFQEVEKHTSLFNLSDNEEVYYWRDFLRKHPNDPWIAKVLDIQGGLRDTYSVMDNIFPPMSLIWLDARGRDGQWFAIFSGVISILSDSSPAVGTDGTVTLQCQNYNQFLNHFPIVKGMNNLGNFEDLNTILTKMQTGEVALDSIFTGKDTRFVFEHTIEVINDLITAGAEEDAFYGGINIWADILGDSNSFETSLPALDTPVVLRNLITDPEDYYNGITLASAFMQKRFTDYEIYKRLVRSNIQLYSIEKEQASTIIQHLADSMFAEFFIDPKGNLRIELPNFNSCPNYKHERYGLANHGENYILSRKDASMKQVDFEFNTGDITTFAKVPFRWVGWAPVPEEGDQSSPIGKADGYSKASNEDLQRYGLKEFTAPTIFSEVIKTTLKKEGRNALAEAVRTKVSQKAGKTVYRLNQRPDLEMNKTIMNVDRGQVHLITSISHNIVPNQSHETSVVCEYSRWVGELLSDPWEEMEKLVVEDFRDREDTNLPGGKVVE